MGAEFALAMAGAASAHQAATATHGDTSQEKAGRRRRTSANLQRAQQGGTAAAVAAPTALDSLSRIQRLADASPQVAQLRRLQALADNHYAPVTQLAGDPEDEELVQGQFAAAGRQPQLQQVHRANNTGLPDQLKSGIESLSGLSMDHVRVHFNSSQPAQLNALAYAQGSDIHLAPGQERHLPHEAWHVVQQAQGRVQANAATADGTPLNKDAGLEREADAMGARARQGAVPAATEGHGSAQLHAAHREADDAPIQRLLGVEVEIGGGDGWRVWKAPPTNKTGANVKLDRVDRGVAIAYGDGFQLQAEDNGNESTIEFVMNAPGAASRDELSRVMGAMVKLGEMLAGFNGKKKLINAKEKFDGTPELLLQPGYTFTGSMQITVGIPLASIPLFFKLLKRLKCEGEYENPINESIEISKGVKRITNEDATPELQGFLTLIRHYLEQGNIEGRRSFPKGVFAVMSRTDWKTLFSMLPESEHLKEKMDDWLKLVLQDYQQDDLLMKQTFNYDETGQKAPFRIKTTREEWIRDMPNSDRMSKDGRNPAHVQIASQYEPPREFSGKPVIREWSELDEKQNVDLAKDAESLYEGIGAYGDKTDLVHYEGEKDSTPTVIVEIRNPPSAGIPGRWHDLALDFWDATEQAIAHPYGHRDPTPDEKKFQHVLSNQQIALKDISSQEELAWKKKFRSSLLNTNKSPTRTCAIL